jgi:glycosyltransferase involved in cell wall biosynthesis
MVKRPCILVLTSTYPRWPGDKEPPFVYELCRRLTDQYEVILLAPHAPFAKVKESWDGIELYRFRYFFEKWQTLAYGGGILSNLKKNRFNILLVPLFLCAQLIATVHILKKHPVSLIHAHWIFPQGLIGLVAAKLAGHKNTPVICTSHGGDLFGLRGALFLTIKRWVIQRSAALTVVSQAMKDYIISDLDNRHIHKISIMPMGVDLQEKFTPDPSVHRKTSELLFVGRLVEKKGLKYLINAMLFVLNHRPDAHLTIAGTGPELPKLLELVDKLQLEKSVSFIGSIHNDELPALYRAATLFVAPFVECANGDQEGLGLVMIEALGCGCPVIASDMPAVKDVNVDGQTGLLTQQRNAQDIAEKILQLLESQALRNKLIVNGRNNVLDKFDWQIVSDRYKKLFSQFHKKNQ